MVGRIMFLVDTNIWLEVLLNQEKSLPAYKFLKKMNASNIFISDFSLYSIGIILLRLGKHDILEKFVNDIKNAGTEVVKLSMDDFSDLIKHSQKYHLDFDDAYQYTLAKKYDIKIVSFDKDFDKTDIKRMEPQELMQS